MTSLDQAVRVIPLQRPFNFKRWFGRTGWRHAIGIVMVVFSGFPLLKYQVHSPVRTPAILFPVTFGLPAGQRSSYGPLTTPSL